MAISWTEDQLRVIESRGGNLLVSAAAGSGKTAVLVERIIRMITEGENPLDIDQLLVMTFTNAAAAEMRERVAAAVDKRLEADPDNRHLQMQAILIPYAQITTIDSFCLSLIRSHFDRLEIDPSFRIGDAGELLLLQGDVMGELLESYYEAGDKKFLNFVEAFGSGKTDRSVEDFIYQVHGFAGSNPWPKRWIADCKKEVEDQRASSWMQTPWMTFLMRDAIFQAEELSSQVTQAVEICREENGPLPYEPMLLSDLDQLLRLAKSKDYEALNEGLKNFSFARLAAVRSKEIDPEKKELVSSVRDRVKKAVARLQENYAAQLVEEAAADLLGTRENTLMLLELAQAYGVLYQEAKKEKNLVDFGDLEHFALNVLLDETNGEFHPSQAADELAAQFEEILVDEYQDSNQVQETLIRAVSGERFGKPNIFMVGDVKQSIYKFRLARPELFLEKYETYTKEKSPCQKIELHQNFRSRSVVLEGINDVFYRIMTKNLGNINYTEETALHPAAIFPPVMGCATEPELLLVDTGKESMGLLDEDMAEFTARELEAKLIAGKIREMTHLETGLPVWDKDLEAYRTACYRDMVILLRSPSGWADIFVNVLMNEGIGASAESRTGYFDTMEVEAVLSLMAVIDNPIQDIPLTAVLKSPFCGLTDEELAWVAAVYKRSPKKRQEAGIYGAARHYLERFESEGIKGVRGDDPGLDGFEEDEADNIHEKLAGFWGKLEEFRQKATYLPIHQLLYLVYEETGYYDYVSAMPAGETRKANLDMLVEKASAFEKTSYRGLFRFIRYIEKIRKFDSDFGEAPLPREQKNTVRIMSIHKSKGLEFPIVFLAGMSKSFNKRDAYGKILIDPDLGVAADYLDVERRLKGSTLKKNVLKRRAELEAMGEELRVLYVAMTRAKEKLVMTAADRSLGKRLEKWAAIRTDTKRLPFTILSAAGCYLDWILMCQADPGVKIRREEIPVTALMGLEIHRQLAARSGKEKLLYFDAERVYDKDYEIYLDQALNYRYPYEEELGLHAKLSVSEIKRQGQNLDNEESEFLPTIPGFMKGEQEKEGGAVRGSAYHRVLELLDFSILKSKQDVYGELETLERQGRIQPESMGLINEEVIWNFLSSPLGQRMAAAQRDGRLFKERQFVIGVPAGEISGGSSKELILIQGIIDAYMEEEDGLVLMDYKTDRISPGEEEKLRERYRMQLKYYERALRQITGKPVKESVIYSLTLQKEIKLLPGK